MIPVTLKQGATKLERWLLNKGEFKKAMDVRVFRGIAVFNTEDESILNHWKTHYYNRVVSKIGIEMQIIYDHILDTEDFDRDWQALSDWMDDDVDYTEYNKMMERRTNYLNNLKISDIHGMGYTSNAHLYFDQYGNERYKFPDGDDYPNRDGRGYALKLGILNEL